MAEQKVPNLQDILNCAAVKKVVDDANRELAERRAFQPPTCNVFSHAYTVLEDTDEHRFTVDKEAELQLPHIITNKVQVIRGKSKVDQDIHKRHTRRRNIGIVFSGGPAPGGHNVIAGLFDAAKRANPENRLPGFLVGPEGGVENEAIEITQDLVDAYRNLGGFTMIKTGRAKIDSKQKIELSRKTCRDLALDALVIVGGDDSNTNAAFLAQEMFNDGIQVIGVPKTIDGDFQVRDDQGHVLCAVSFGFHTAARAFANSIAGLCNDASSDIKYYHVCKVMGRVASHLALEVALQAHPNMTVIGEELVDYVDVERLVKAQREKTTDYTAFGMTLRHLSRMICDGIVKRATAGKNYGVIVIPEGVLEFTKQIEVFIMKLNSIIADYNPTHRAPPRPRACSWAAAPRGRRQRIPRPTGRSGAAPSPPARRPGPGRSFPGRKATTFATRWRFRGTGKSTPIVWRDLVIVTATLPTLKKLAPRPTPTTDAAPSSGRRNPDVRDVAQSLEFVVLALSRADGQVRWRRTVRVEHRPDGRTSTGPSRGARP